MEKIPEPSLEMVSGGTGGGKSTVEILLHIPDGMTEDVSIRVYVDGALDRSKTTVLEETVRTKTFRFTGSGKSEVKFRMMGSITVDAIYTIDFDSGMVVGC